MIKINKADTEGSEICKRNEAAVINSEPILGIMAGVDIPEWLLIEVLIRLPVKLIFRLKIVCKHWLSVISDPSFVRMYISRVSLLQPLQPWTIVSLVMRFEDHARTLDFLKFESAKNIYSRELKCPSYLLFRRPCSLQPQDRNIIICGISNGLVLCAQHVPSSDCFGKTIIYNICNPITGQWIALPEQTCLFKNQHKGFLTQVENGMLKSYRVVSLDWLGPITNTLIFHVFFSEIGEWKDFTVSIDLEIESIWERLPTDFHGNLHWLLMNEILAYDPYKKPDDFRIIPLPRDKDQLDNQPRESGITSLCCVSDGKLRYIRQLQIPSFEVWILNDYISGDWSLRNRINHFDIHSGDIPRCVKMSILPIAFDPYDSDILYLGHGNVIVSYNIETKRSELHGHHPLTDRQAVDHKVRYYHLPGWFGVMFLIPPWPTSIHPPSFKSADK